MDARSAVDGRTVVSEGAKSNAEIVERIGVGIVGASSRADANSCGSCVVSIVADWTSGHA